MNQTLIKKDDFSSQCLFHHVGNDENDEGKLYTFQMKHSHF